MRALFPSFLALLLAALVFLFSQASAESQEVADALNALAVSNQTFSPTECTPLPCVVVVDSQGMMKRRCEIVHDSRRLVPVLTNRLRFDEWNI